MLFVWHCAGCLLEAHNERKFQRDKQLFPYCGTLRGCAGFRDLRLWRICTYQSSVSVPTQRTLRLHPVESNLGEKSSHSEAHITSSTTVNCLHQTCIKRYLLKSVTPRRRPPRDTHKQWTVDWHTETSPSTGGVACWDALPQRTTSLGP